MACFYSVCKEDQCARQCHMLLLSPERRRHYKAVLGNCEIDYIVVTVHQQ